MIFFNIHVNLIIIGSNVPTKNTNSIGRIRKVQFLFLEFDPLSNSDRERQFWAFPSLTYLAYIFVEFTLFINKLKIKLSVVFKF